MHHGPTASVLTSGDPVFFAPSTESAETVRARLEVRDLNATSETGTGYGGPLVVENTRTVSATNVIAQFISAGEHQNSVVTVASDDDRAKIYARHAIDAGVSDDSHGVRGRDVHAVSSVRGEQRPFLF